MRLNRGTRRAPDELIHTDALRRAYFDCRSSGTAAEAEQALELAGSRIRDLEALAEGRPTEARAARGGPVRRLASTLRRLLPTSSTWRG